eukprot:4491927-Alexandrium_andersonii.AAC.1
MDEPIVAHLPSVKRWNLQQDSSATLTSSTRFSRPAHSDDRNKRPSTNCSCSCSDRSSAVSASQPRATQSARRWSTSATCKGRWNSMRRDTHGST